MKKNSALIIGAVTAAETGYTGKLDTLAIKANNSGVESSISSMAR